MNHINIYSKSESQLGRMLSNFYRCGVNTEHGKFNSVEGYWYYLKSGDPHLKELSGYEAKSYGRKVALGFFYSEEEFKTYICTAIANKIIDNKEIYNLFIESELAFEHYYMYNGKKIYPDKNEWVVEFTTFFRKYLKNYEKN